MTEYPPNPDDLPGSEPGQDAGVPEGVGIPPAPGGFEPPAAPGWQNPPQQGWGAAPGQGWGHPAPGSWGGPPGPGGGMPPPGQGFPPAGPYGYAPPPKPGVVPLRPLGLGDMLDGAFQAVRRNAGSTLGLSVIVQLFIGTISALLAIPLLTVIADPGFADGAEPDFSALAGSLITMVAGSLAAGLASVFLMIIVQGAITIPVLRATLNRKTRFGQALRILRPSIGRLLLVALLYLIAGIAALAICAGIVTLVAFNADTAATFTTAAIVVVLAIPTTLWISIKLTFTVHAVVAENLPPLAAMARSFALVKSSWWRCFGILLLTGIIVAIITSLITSPLSMISGLLGGMLAPEDPAALAGLLVKIGFVSTILGGIAAGLGFAYECSVTTLLYTDLRFRRDGFDMTLLREFDSGIDAPIPGLPTVPPAGNSPGYPAGR
ncbi:hypothetical protein ACT3S2_07585 [Arthrobacter sp. AOP36-A1-22]|uniref:hypothetical protein n=1 Tax=Arthrobacter sp. AOP36-A1-22 TaxID=3457684 RepID=UPI004033B3EA